MSPASNFWSSNTLADLCPRKRERIEERATAPEGTHIWLYGGLNMLEPWDGNSLKGRLGAGSLG